MFSAPESFAVNETDLKKSGMKCVKAQCSGFKIGPGPRKCVDLGAESALKKLLDCSMASLEEV